MARRMRFYFTVEAGPFSARSVRADLEELADDIYWNEPRAMVNIREYVSGWFGRRFRLEARGVRPEVAERIQAQFVDAHVEEEEKEGQEDGKDKPN